MNAIGRRHWCLALGAALAIHAGVALAMAWPDPPRSGAQMPGLAGLEISLGAAEAVVTAPPEPAPVPADKPAVPQPAPVQPASQTESTVAASDVATVGETAEVPPEAEATDAAGSSAPGAGADTGISVGDDTAGGGTPGSVADYYALLQAWLEQHRRYPQRARERKQEGVAYVFFVLDLQGRVLEQRLERSSGFPLLDEEVLAMVARADPMPPIPGDMGRSSLSIVVPVAFTLR